MPMNLLVLTPYLYDTVPGQRFRIEQWARRLESEGVRCVFEPFESDRLRQARYAPGSALRKAQEMVQCLGRRTGRLRRFARQPWDAVFLFRELAPVGPPILERMLAQRGIPIVYDFDDAIFLADVSEANRGFGWLKWPRKIGAICRMSAHVTVGNRYLEAFARRYTDRVSVIPTTIDTERYRPKPSTEITGRPVIGWSGSLTTVKHLQMALPALRSLRRLIDFRLKVIGGPAVGFEGLDVEHRPWEAHTELAEIQSFDVGIMPLPDDAWARGKCGLKALQYLAAGVPTVVSPVGVNSEIVTDGVNGFWASTDAEWVDTLHRLLTDAALRAQFAREGRRTVETRYSAVMHAPRLLRILGDVTGHRSRVLSEPLEAVAVEGV